MKRAIVALTAAIGLTVGMTFLMAGIGITQVTLGCSDGTNVTMTVDTDTLTSLTKSVQALLDYPAGLTCTLAQTPVVRFGNVADAALVPGFVNGGGRFLGSCGPGGGTFWINIAVNAHNQDGNVVGTVNQTIPDGQCIAAGGFTSTPTCLHIFSEDLTLAWVTSLVNTTSGSFFPSQGVTGGTYARFSFRDNGNPDQQTDFDKIGETPAGGDQTCAGIANNTPLPFINLSNGNITVHQS